MASPPNQGQPPIVRPRLRAGAKWIYRISRPTLKNRHPPSAGVSTGVHGSIARGSPPLLPTQQPRHAADEPQHAHNGRQHHRANQHNRHDAAQKLPRQPLKTVNNWQIAPHAIEHLLLIVQIGGKCLVLLLQVGNELVNKGGHRVIEPFLD